MWLHSYIPNCGFTSGVVLEESNHCTGFTEILPTPYKMRLLNKIHGTSICLFCVYCHVLWVTIDGVCMGNWIYWSLWYAHFVTTLHTRKSLSHRLVVTNLLVTTSNSRHPPSLGSQTIPMPQLSTATTVPVITAALLYTDCTDHTDLIRIWDFHGSDSEECRLVSCGIIWVLWEPMF